MLFIPWKTICILMCFCLVTIQLAQFCFVATQQGQNYTHGRNWFVSRTISWVLGTILKRSKVSFSSISSSCSTGLACFMGRRTVAGGRVVAVAGPSHMHSYCNCCQRTPQPLPFICPLDKQTQWRRTAESSHALRDVETEHLKLTLPPPRPNNNNATR